MSESKRIKAPWYFWLIGIFALLWNTMGGIDYLFTQLENDTYLSFLSPEQRDFFTSFPSWVVASWAIAVWSAFLGSILLLFRNALATCMFLISLIFMVLNFIYLYAFSRGMEMMGDTFSLVFNTILFIVAIFLYFYARKMQKRNIIT